MAHAPSASDKEKTARLVESLSRHDQVELLAQALLREYMHRHGLRETLRAFDAENPRDERTISSRALMRQLLNIPVEGRPSRLQPTSSGGKPQAATFMEELCSYRLTKRECAAQRQRSTAAGGEALEDPSDVELRALHAAADARRVAKASCERKQREFEELLAADVAYQRRKEEHKKRKRKKRGRQSKHGSRQRTDADGEDDDDEDEAEEACEDNASADEESEADEAEDESTSRRGSSSLAPPKRGGKKASRGHASDLIVGSGWQPPGLASAGATATGAAEGSTRRQPRHASGDGGRLELGIASRSGAQRDRADRGNESSADDDDAAAADPFGLSGSSRKAWMERVRAESGRWPTHNNSSSSGAADGGGGLAPGGGGSGGDGRGGGTPATQLSALHALGGQGSAALGQAALGSVRGLGGGRGLAGAGFSSAIATAPPSASASPSGGGGGSGTLRMRAAGPIPIPGMSEPEGGGGGGGRPPGMYGGPSGYMPPPPLSAAPSILVKHTDGVSSGSNSASASPVYSYDRSAVPRSSAMAGGSSNSSSIASPLPVTRAVSPTGAGGSAGRAVVRSPSPKALSVGGGPSSPSVFLTPSRASGGASAGGGGSGLRHGIGFRTTSTSAEGTAAGTAPSLAASAAAAGGTAPSDGGSASKSNRKERRVKLLVD